MTCRTVTETEIRKHTEDRPKSIHKEHKRKHFMNNFVAEDVGSFKVTNKKCDNLLSKLTKSSGGISRISFKFIAGTRENSVSSSASIPRTENSRKNKSGKCSKQNVHNNNRHSKQNKLKTRTEVSEKDTSDVEKRRESIRQKLTSFINPVFTEEEECDISERAEEYSSTILPHEHYFLLQENIQETEVQDSETFTEVTNFVYNNPLMVQKKRRRSYSNIDRFVTHDVNYSESAQILPEGTKLLKPPSKLVELVAQSIDESPDGMLQVQQIYTVLQNRFPYFRYMDKAAISSWRSSVRHALYQKWFQKIKFSLESINSKGCFWSINYSLSPNEWAMPQSPACRLKTICVPSDVSKTKNNVEEQATVLKAVSYSNIDNNQSESEDVKEFIQSENEYGITICEPGSDIKENSPQLNIPSPVKDPDPMLIACIPDWDRTPSQKPYCFLDGSRETSNCTSPYSVSSACEAFQTPPCSPSPTWELSQNELSLFSPLYNSLLPPFQVFPDQIHTPKSNICLNDLLF